jgi:hypothetical protein
MSEMHPPSPRASFEIHRHLSMNLVLAFPLASLLPWVIFFIVGIVGTSSVSTPLLYFIADIGAMFNLGVYPMAFVIMYTVSFVIISIVTHIIVNCRHADH